MKSKEQKRKEALERNITKYYNHLAILLKMLPGGEWYESLPQDATDRRWLALTCGNTGSRLRK